MARWYDPSEDRLERWEAWLAGRAPQLREVLARFPPWELFRLTREDGKEGNRVFVVGAHAHAPGCGCQDGAPLTLTVRVDYRFNELLFERDVFGIDPDCLVPCEVPAPKDTTAGQRASYERAATAWLN